MLSKFNTIPDKLLGLVLKQDTAAADECQTTTRSRLIFCNSRNLCGGYCYEYRRCTYCRNRGTHCGSWYGCSCHKC